LRYLFRGLIRETGKPVVGHVEADTEETAFNALADNGIVTESLSPDPKPSFPSPGQAQPSPYADALDSAFDTSAHQIAFDDLTERYRGKRVWVIDRDKIRKRVAQVVDEAMSAAQTELDTDTETRQRVAKAIEGLFKDSKNITSPQQMPPPTPPGYSAQASGPGAAGLDAQVNRLAGLITTAEGVLAAIQAAARGGSFGGGGGGGGRRRGRVSRANMVQNDVLLEIFKSNMQLQRGTVPAVGAAGSPAGEGSPPSGEPGESAAAPAEDTGEAAKSSSSTTA
jgi:hypothetical protein